MGSNRSGRSRDRSRSSTSASRFRGRTTSVTAEPEVRTPPPPSLTQVMTTKGVQVTRTSTRDLLIVACAVSAGVHAALVPEHLHESTAAGGGFIAATLLLGALCVALSVRRVKRLAFAVAALTFAGLLASYALAVTSGMPVLMPQPEPIDGLALATKAVELVGLFAALALVTPISHTRQ